MKFTSNGNASTCFASHSEVTLSSGNALKEPHASHVYFVIRQDARKTDILLQTIDTTWRAYNNYAAPSTYGVLPLPRHNFSMPESWQNRRAYKVSYNAPLMTRDTRAVNTLFNAEMPAIRWLESHGYDVQYWTGVDAHSRGGEIERRAKVYVSVGHDEYWSGEQRLHVEAARDAGSSTSLVFFSLLVCSSISANSDHKKNSAAFFTRPNPRRQDFFSHDFC